MRIKNKSLIFSIIIIVLTFLNTFFLIFSFQLFPVKGGYTRQILFIKPNEENGNEGYFIILDELAPESQKYEIDWLLHSRGDLIKSQDEQSLTYTVKSYTTLDDISLNVNFLENIKKITESQGIFCPENYRENNNYPDLYTSYIKARYSGRENPLMGTVLYPKNNSDSSQKFPSISKLDNDLKKIGENDFLFYQLTSGEKSFSDPNIQFNGKSLFIRKNNFAGDSLELVYLQDASKIMYGGQTYFLSSDLVENVLFTYTKDFQITGYINGKKTEISIYCPIEVKNVKVNDRNVPFNNSNSIVSFKIEGSSSFIITEKNDTEAKEANYLKQANNIVKEPEKEAWELNENVFEAVRHPYILYNSDELREIREKITDPNKPWNQWYNEYFLNIESVINNSPETYEDDQRYHNVYKLALKFAIENNQTCLEKVKQYLLDMDSITHYSQDLRRAKNVQAYAIAYDMVYNNLTQTENKEIYDNLYNHSVPLKRMDLYHRNNHRVVDAGALGCAGLVLQNKEMIDIAINTGLDYFYNQNPADGGSFEGYSYIAYAIRELSQFAIGLRRIGAFDFYQDPKFLATLNYIGETLGPLGMPGSFEDCTFDPRIQESLIIAAAQVKETHPEMAKNFQYIWEQRQNNTNLPGAKKYRYLEGENPSFRRILCYSVKDTIIPKAYNFRQEVWNASSMAYLRHGGKNGFFMPFSCKNYDQNHPHQDENSFELWAYGAYLINNPGYPGWGKPYHTWSQSTEGANSLLIGGEGQLQVIAEGLKSSISSSYFSMVMGEATEIYNDAGAFIYVPEFYLLLIFNFIMLLMGSGFYYSLFKYKTKKDKKKSINSIEHIRNKPQFSKERLVKELLFHPFRIQEVISQGGISSSRRLFIKRNIYALLSGSVGLFFVLSCIDVNQTLVYHSQYYEDKYTFIFQLIPYIIFAIFTIGTMIMIFLTFYFIKFHAKLNHSISCKLFQKRVDKSLDKSSIKTSSVLSSFWMFPVLIFAEILIFLTTVQRLKVAIHGLWTELNSINDVYNLLVSVLIELMRNFGIILLIGFPFIFLLVTSFGYGISLNTKSIVSPKEGIQINLIGLFIILVMVFLIFSLFYVIFKAFFSFISIEMIVN
jgi:hypothetical protein